MKMRTFIYIAIILFCSKPCYSQSVKSNFNLQTKEEAYNKAIEYTGFNSKDYSFKALSENNIKLELLEEENLAFVDDSIIGKEVWSIRFENVSLNLSGWVQSFKDEQIIKDYSIIIEANTGTLVKIIGKSDTLKNFFYDEMSKDYLERKLEGSGEKWLSFSNSPPAITFEMALHAAVPSSPLMAEEIHAVCVYQKDLNNESRLIWMITGNNIPETVMLGKKVRSLIDAHSGKLLSAKTFP